MASRLKAAYDVIVIRWQDGKRCFPNCHRPSLIEQIVVGLREFSLKHIRVTSPHEVSLSQTHDRVFNILIINWRVDQLSRRPYA